MTGEPGSPAERAGERAARNTLARAAGEIVGKLASLLLFAVMARELGQAEVGVFVFALAFGQVAIAPTGLGLDRFLLRRVAADRSRSAELGDVLAIKVTLALPAIAIACVAIALIADDARTRDAVLLLMPGLLVESLTRSHFSVFNALERGDLLSATIVVQRCAAAALGLGALAAGLGVVAVAGTYSAGAVIGAALAALFLRRRLGVRQLRVERSGWRRLGAGSAPFAAQDLLGAAIAKVDVIMLGLISSQAAVGRYGAAYRLLEATFFLSSAVNGAFAAMYTYLSNDSDPPLRAVFERSVKLLLAVLVPCAVTLGVVAEPVTRLFFGSGFEAAAGPLRLLAPCVVLMGLVYLCTSLVVSRGNPGVMVWVTAGMLAVNVGLNAVLIPSHADEGAAIAMLATEALAAAVCLGLASRRAGGVPWVRMLAAPLAAGAAMAPPMLLLDHSLPLALLAGLPLYAAVYVAIERLLAPDDLRFVWRFVSRRPERGA